jgi:hypothetical protein
MTTLTYHIARSFTMYTGDLVVLVEGQLGDFFGLGIMVRQGMRTELWWGTSSKKASWRTEELAGGK